MAALDGRMLCGEGGPVPEIQETPQRGIGLTVIIIFFTAAQTVALILLLMMWQSLRDHNQSGQGLVLMGAVLSVGAIVGSAGTQIG